MYAVGSDVDERAVNRGQAIPGAASLNFLRALPGGVAPQSQETAVALFVVGAFVFLVAIRRGFRPLIAR